LFPSRPKAVIRIALLTLLVTAACGSIRGREAGSTLYVSAASSLIGTFTELAERYHDRYPDVEVALNFAGSQELAAQVEEGAPVDVIATADTVTMDRLVDGGFVDAGAPTEFARNQLEIVVPAGNPAAVRSLRDLADPDLVVILAAPEVPLGGYTEEVLDLAGVEVHARSLETDAKAVVSRILLGEADAGIVYTTDVLAAGDDVAGVPFPEAARVEARYAISATTDTEQDAAANAFVDLIVSDVGTMVLTEAGFSVP
jgi:molybdate transport system substrate-binding protein